MISDRLFGNCQRDDRSKDYYEYFLDRTTLQTLEEATSKLIGLGYTWENVYTQCVLGNILLAFRRGITPDPNWCERAGIEKNNYDQEIIDDTASILEKYFSEYYNSLQNRDRPALLDRSSEDIVDTDYPQGGFSGPTQKKDEFVKIHKYFSNEKRDDDKRYEDNNDILYPASSSEKDFVGDNFVDPGYSRNSEEDGLGDGFDELLSRLQPADLAAIKLYLSGINEQLSRSSVDTPDLNDLQVSDQ